MDAISMMVAWIMTGMTAWGAPLPAAADARRAEIDRRTVIATEMVTVAFDRNEPSIFHGPHGRAESLVLLARVAGHESGYRASIEAGACRADECDGGRAFGLMQIHPAVGIVLTDDGSWRYRAPDEFDGVITGRELTADLETTFRVGERMLRTSLEAVGHLGGYTGEHVAGPKARLMLNTATRWFRMHPPPASDEAVEASLDGCDDTIADDAAAF